MSFQAPYYLHYEAQVHGNRYTARSIQQKLPTQPCVVQPHDDFPTAAVKVWIPVETPQEARYKRHKASLWFMDAPTAFRFQGLYTSDTHEKLFFRDMQEPAFPRVK